ncbi:Oligopeptide transporter [Thalictrum thalictroides]|uniref:Oligopeptide transporter n=1 Tax=Thalictrum thalictroides TaxID=46969 RepID=A0A7J6UST7_THATH|nr:Oligopeptide transporter [Thalictrum thalictroides]
MVRKQANEEILRKEEDGEKQWEVQTMENGDELTEEQIFASKENVLPWKKQITLRSMVVSVILGTVFSFIVMKLNVSTGIIPSLNVAAGLLGFFLVKAWTKVLGFFGIKSQPFTRQENTVIQTCVVAAYGIAFSSGFASYILGMSPKIAAQAETENTPINSKNLSLSWMIPFTLVVSFVGLFSIVFLRKTMIIDYKLTYPSGTATASLINSFHIPREGAKQAEQQVKKLFTWFGASFFWAFFQWFFTAGDGCGFASFPTFGLQAFKQKFFFDFSTTYVGVGMLCPHSINLSMLFGSVISWGIMWPLIAQKKGQWYSADLPPSNLRSLQGYKVFIAIATILGDGLFHFVLLLCKTMYSIYKRHQMEKNSNQDNSSVSSSDLDEMSYDDARRKEYFLKDQISPIGAAFGYLAFAVISIAVVPIIFHQIRWYHVVFIYIIAPIMAFCNSYGCGLTDWSLASNYGKIAILVFGAMIGSNGGVVAGLAACGVMMSIVSTASDLMQDFKTGYLTLASPRSMFASQVFGTLIGCFVSPTVFWFLFYKVYPDLGQPTSKYPAPYGLLYRSISFIGIEGTKALPKNCVNLSIGFFIGAILVNGLIELLKVYEWKVHKYIPKPMAMAIPFYLGGYFTIDMCVGSLILFIWEKMNKEKSQKFSPAVASGLICGESLWGVPASILSMANVQPPICMKFLSSAVNTKIDAFLESS